MYGRWSYWLLAIAGILQYTVMAAVKPTGYVDLNTSYLVLWLTIIGACVGCWMSCMGGCGSCGYGGGGGCGCCGDGCSCGDCADCRGEGMGGHEHGHEGHDHGPGEHSH